MIEEITSEERKRSRQSLEEVIEQMVNLGEKDPLTIAKKVFERFDKLWVGAELLMLAEDLIADMARRQLGAVRRSAELAIHPGDEIADNNMRLAKMWIPGEGYKVVAEVTASDLHKKSNWYRNFAAGALKRAVWCEQVIDLLKNEQVEMIGQLKKGLPMLPEEDELPLGLLPPAT